MREDAVFYWVGGSLDQMGWESFTAALRKLIVKVSDLEVESTRRVAKGKSETFPTTFGILGFESPKSTSKKQRKKSKPKRAKG